MTLRHSPDRTLLRIWVRLQPCRLSLSQLRAMRAECRRFLRLAPTARLNGQPSQA